MEQNKLSEIQSAAASVDSREANYKPFGSFWGHSYFTKWAAIAHALFALGLREGDAILDIGVGGGWSTLFLAETGFRATGMDIAPASVAVARRRAERYHSEAEFVAADMDTLDLGRQFDAVLVFDALHHSQYQSLVIERISRHLNTGGWAVFGEPTWLHTISPRARRTHRETGWIERGVTLRSLKRDCAANGMTRFRRFYEGTSPFAPGVGPFLFELARLVGAQVNVSPRTSLWLAAQKLEYRAPSHHRSG
jgi:2-polyprenyl-3-methyl-5-hydroxy-6-metoxy-1,4-benzoquinol methylase